MEDTMQKVAEVLAELEDTIDQYEDMNGSNEFTEGVLAVINLLTGDEDGIGVTDVESFVKHYLTERQ